MSEDTSRSGRGEAPCTPISEWISALATGSKLVFPQPLGEIVRYKVEHDVVLKVRFQTCFT